MMARYKVSQAFFERYSLKVISMNGSVSSIAFDFYLEARKNPTMKELIMKKLITLAESSMVFLSSLSK